MSRLNRTLILLAMAIQALVVCSDLMQTREPERVTASDVAAEPSAMSEEPAPRPSSPFVACYEQEAR